MCVCVRVVKVERKPMEAHLAQLWREVVWRADHCLRQLRVWTQDFCNAKVTQFDDAWQVRGGK